VLNRIHFFEVCLLAELLAAMGATLVISSTTPSLQEGVVREPEYLRQVSV
jgi:hypothetical protein